MVLLLLRRDAHPQEVDSDGKTPDELAEGLLGPGSTFDDLVYDAADRNLGFGPLNPWPSVAPSHY